MNTVTKQWIEQVREEHRRLEAMVEDLQDFLDTPRPKLGAKGAHTWAAEMSRRLVDLHDELFRHFRFEEDSGMLEEIQLDHPEAARDAERIVSDHAEILKSLRDLMTNSLAYSEGIEPEDRALRKRVTDLLQRFREHETEENHLIQRVEYRVFGGGD